MVEVSGAELGWGSYVPGKPFGGAGEVSLCVELSAPGLDSTDRRKGSSVSLEGGGAEVDLDFGGQRKAAMRRQLFTAIPSQGSVQFPRQAAGTFDQRIHHGLRVLSVDFDQHDVTGFSLHEHRNPAIAVTE